MNLAHSMGGVPCLLEILGQDLEAGVETVWLKSLHSSPLHPCHGKKYRKNAKDYPGKEKKFFSDVANSTNENSSIFILQLRIIMTQKFMKPNKNL